MKAIEINSKTDKNGYLKIDYPLNKTESHVRILILLDDDSIEPEDESAWLLAISGNPAFNFLHNPIEEVYTLDDRVPFND